jgi:hypothetical protein
VISDLLPHKKIEKSGGLGSVLNCLLLSDLLISPLPTPA